MNSTQWVEYLHLMMKEDPVFERPCFFNYHTNVISIKYSQLYNIFQLHSYLQDLSGDYRQGLDW
jgi:hypothetical protein